MDPRLRAPALKGDVEALTTALEAGANPNLHQGAATVLVEEHGNHVRTVPAET